MQVSNVEMYLGKSEHSIHDNMKYTYLDETDLRKKILSWKIIAPLIGDKVPIVLQKYFDKFDRFKSICTVCGPCFNLNISHYWAIEKDSDAEKPEFFILSEVK